MPTTKHSAKHHSITRGAVPPFGMLAKSYSDSIYRFGFNGKEKDDEVLGKGRWQDYGERLYRPDLIRFFTPDPLIVYGQKYPWYSPFQFAGNKPIWAIDLDGLEEFYSSQGTLIYQHNDNGVSYVVDDDYLNYQVLTKVLTRRIDPSTGEFIYEYQFQYLSFNYSAYEEGGLSENSDAYQNLMKHSYGNKVGNAVVQLYIDDPKYAEYIDCVLSSYLKVKYAVENILQGDFPDLGSPFYQIWSVQKQDEKLGVNPNLLNRGSPAAIDWANMGKVLGEKEIWGGQMKPGNPMTYRGNPSHSFIFLGYDYDDDGNIIGMFTWNQWGLDYIAKSDNKNLMGANMDFDSINTQEENEE